MSVRKLSDMSETMKGIYEPLVREQIVKESALLGMMKDTLPEPKPSKYCHDYLDWNDSWFSCQQKTGHKGKHWFKSKSEGKKFKVAWK